MAVLGKFELVPTKPPELGSAFEFQDYLAALALLLVVLASSDFRYKYRSQIARFNFVKIGLGLAASVGAVILTTDIWYQNKLLVPRILLNPNNTKSLLSVVLLVIIFWVLSIAIVRPPCFSKRSAPNFFKANRRLFQEGVPERLQFISEELGRSIAAIFDVASRETAPREEDKQTERPASDRYATDMIMLLADQRFCKVVVANNPAFAFDVFCQVAKHPSLALVSTPFCRNIGLEFIRNENSLFYQEDREILSGFFGRSKPVSTGIFGSYDIVELLARVPGSPLDVKYGELRGFNRNRIEAFSRACLAFFEDYLKRTKGRHEPHSVAINRMLKSFKVCLSSVKNLDGIDKVSQLNEYHHLRTTAKFVRDASILIERYACLPHSRKIEETSGRDMYDCIAELAFEVILAGSTVKAPLNTSWMIQHKVAWKVLGSTDTRADRVIRAKCRRMIYRELRGMDLEPNRRGAQIVGTCLNVLGVNLAEREDETWRDFRGLHRCILDWVLLHFEEISYWYPQALEALLQGAVGYVQKEKKLTNSLHRTNGVIPQYLSLE